MIDFDSKNLHGIYIDNKYLVQKIELDSSVALNFNTVSQIDRSSAILNGKDNGTLTITSTTTSDNYSYKNGTTGYFTSINQCLGLDCLFSTTTSDIGYHNVGHICLHGDTSDGVSLISALKASSNFGSISFPSSCGWKVFVEYDVWGNETNIRLYLNGTSIFTYNWSGNKSILVSMNITRENDTYKCLIVIYNGSTTSSGTVYNSSVYLMGVTDRLFRPIISGSLDTGSTSSPNTITMVVTPKLCLDYKSVRITN